MLCLIDHIVFIRTWTWTVLENAGTVPEALNTHCHVRGQLTIILLCLYLKMFLNQERFQHIQLGIVSQFERFKNCGLLFRTSYIYWQWLHSRKCFQVPTWKKFWFRKIKGSKSGKFLNLGKSQNWWKSWIF